MCPLLLQNLQASQVEGAPSSASKETQQVQMYVRVYMYTNIYAYVHIFIRLCVIRLACVCPPVRPSVCLCVCVCLCVYDQKLLLILVCRCTRGNDPSFVGCTSKSLSNRYIDKCNGWLIRTYICMCIYTYRVNI